VNTSPKIHVNQDVCIGMYFRCLEKNADFRDRITAKYLHEVGIQVIATKVPYYKVALPHKWRAVDASISHWGEGDRFVQKNTIIFDGNDNLRMVSTLQKLASAACWTKGSLQILDEDLPILDRCLNTCCGCSLIQPNELENWREAFLIIGS
jgi:hypothetical protein